MTGKWVWYPVAREWCWLRDDRNVGTIDEVCSKIDDETAYNRAVRKA